MLEERSNYMPYATRQLSEVTMEVHQKKINWVLKLIVGADNSFVSSKVSLVYELLRTACGTPCGGHGVDTMRC